MAIGTISFIRKNNDLIDEVLGCQKLNQPLKDQPSAIKIKRDWKLLLDK
ncbi:MAG: hypothetical protein JWR61_16 [Ferruginibacter sp.]|nr:hypothetical protein [Ferruginibacter sp.]MDB5275061.1 hypothetical protein [Ferruginibacter sp.]